MSRANDSAFPAYGTSPGLTKREYFAAMAMQGLLAEPSDNDEGDNGMYSHQRRLHIAEEAVRMADALIGALNTQTATARSRKNGERA